MIIIIPQNHRILVPILVPYELKGSHELGLQRTTLAILDQNQITRTQFVNESTILIVLPFALLIRQLQLLHRFLTCPQHVLNDFIHIQLHTRLINLILESSHL